MKKQKEMNLFLGRHGGRRPNSGKTRLHSPGVSHEKRETVTEKTPIHVNWKYDEDVRCEAVLKLLQKAFLRVRDFNFEVCVYSLQLNHIHIIAEVKDNESLTKAMRSITSIIGRGMNGPRQIERYHLHVLRSPREVENAVQYVLNNEYKHSGKSSPKWSGFFSTPKSWLLKRALTASS